MGDMGKLEKWKGALNKCIRCGYCYEHCPIYKSTRWEIDSPRGKLILLYGLLSGEIEPSEYVAGKLMECFHCGRCQKACSSGVPIQDVYQDARELLLEAGFEVPGTTSRTDTDVCALCLNCVRMCKHEARSFVDGLIVTDLLKCQSCGSCLDICPKQGVTIGRGFGTNPDELDREVAAFFADGRNPEAKAVVFSCGWSNYPGMQTASYEPDAASAEYKVLVTVCSGRIRSETILSTLDAGAWGVLVVSCPEEDCEHGGSPRVKARLEALLKPLAAIGVDPGRVQVAEVAQGNPRKFLEATQAFMKDVRALGPLLVRSEA
jgi:coenzyme F420-reducing hydrogenase delta subunit/heterodisulfide reductase subunit C